MLNHQYFGVIYTYPSRIDDAIAAFRKMDISVLAIQQPGSEVTEPDSDQNITIFADLSNDDSLGIISQAATLLMPKMLVFGVSAERGEDRFIVTQTEAKIIEDLFWLHAGKAGFIQTSFITWPSRKGPHQNANHTIEEVAA